MMNEFLMIGACLFWIFMISPELDRLYLKEFNMKWVYIEVTGDLLMYLFFIWQMIRLLMFVNGLLF